MEKKYYTGEQILEALSEVGVGAGDTSEVLSYLGRLPSAEPEIIRSKDSIVYRKDVVEALYQAIRTQLQGTFTDSMSLAISMAKALPSAEPEQKTGKWLPDNNNYYEERFVCSECKGNFKVATCMGKPMWKFCPNCGSYNGGGAG